MSWNNTAAASLEFGELSVHESRQQQVQQPQQHASASWGSTDNVASVPFPSSPFLGVGGLGGSAGPFEAAKSFSQPGPQHQPSHLAAGNSMTHQSNPFQTPPPSPTGPENLSWGRVEVSDGSGWAQAGSRAPHQGPFSSPQPSVGGGPMPSPLPPPHSTSYSLPAASSPFGPSPLSPAPPPPPPSPPSSSSSHYSGGEGGGVLLSPRKSAMSMMPRKTCWKARS